MRLKRYKGVTTRNINDKNQGTYKWKIEIYQFCYTNNQDNIKIDFEKMKINKKIKILKKKITYFRKGCFYFMKISNVAFNLMHFYLEMLLKACCKLHISLCGFI